MHLVLESFGDGDVADGDDQPVEWLRHAVFTLKRHKWGWQDPDFIEAVFIGHQNVEAGFDNGSVIVGVGRKDRVLGVKPPTGNGDSLAERAAQALEEVVRPHHLA